MSLITCCPACATMFKVVPDQLKISEGWVRCGHCGEIFDASAYLQADESWITQPASLAPDPASTRPMPLASATLERQDEAPESFASSLHTEIGEESISSEMPDSALLEATAQSLVEHPLDRPFELRRDDGAAAQVQRDLPVHAAADSQAEPALEDLSFVRQADRKAAWRRPAVRALLALALLALGALLALQVALFDRDRLAAANPALRPWLVRLCDAVRCTIGPPRLIDAVAIDSSSFNKLRADAYRLNVTLKNQAASEIAMPALELTLTDGQDQAVVRRVLAPEELTPAAGAIPASGEWSGSASLVVGASAGGNRVAGYRLLAFYP